MEEIEMTYVKHQLEIDMAEYKPKNISEILIIAKAIVRKRYQGIVNNIEIDNVEAGICSYYGKISFYRLIPTTGNREKINATIDKILEADSGILSETRFDFKDFSVIYSDDNFLKVEPPFSESNSVHFSNSYRKFIKSNGISKTLEDEVSYNELSAIAGVDKKTAANYIQLLEKTFVIFRLSPFSRNLRNELKKMRKIYFYDTGVRNALINNFNPLNLRTDTGALWENFMISERMKYNNNQEKAKNIYFWRTHLGKEIDYLEDYEGKLEGYEFKWEKDNFTKPKEFLETYKNSSIELINRKNFQKFV